MLPVSFRLGAGLTRGLHMKRYSSVLKEDGTQKAYIVASFTLQATTFLKTCIFFIISAYECYRSGTGRTLLSDSLPQRKDTIAPCDQFQQNTLEENLVLKYNIQSGVLRLPPKMFYLLFILRSQDLHTTDPLANCTIIAPSCTRSFRSYAVLSVSWFQYLFKCYREIPLE